MQGSDLVVSVQLKADGSGLVGQVRLAKAEVEQLGIATVAAGKEATALGAGARAAAAGVAAIGAAASETREVAGQIERAGAAADSLGTDARTAAAGVAAIGASTAGREVAADLGVASAAAEALLGDVRQLGSMLAASARDAELFRTQLASAGGAASALDEITRQAREAAQAIAALGAGVSNLPKPQDPIAPGGGGAGAYAAELKRLRAEIDPVGEAQRRMAQATDFASTAFEKGDLSADEYAAALKRAQAIGVGQISSLGNQRQAMIQLGQQTQDFAVQVSSGHSAATAFAQQIGQAAFAVQNMGGKMTGVAAFLMSGWGIAATIALTVLAPLVSKLFEGAEGSEKLKNESLSLTEALTDEKFGTDAARKALEDYVKQQERARESDSLSIALTLADADAQLKRAAGIRATLAAKLALAKADYEASQEGSAYGGTAGGGGGLAGNAYAAQVSALKQAIAENNEDIAKTEQARRELLIKGAGETAAAATDPMKALNLQYDRQRDTAIRAAEGNDRLAESLDGVLTRIERQRKVALDAERDRQRQATSAARQGPLTEFLNPVAGGRVTGSFGERRPGHPHGGVDYAVPVGTPVRAPASGTITEAGERQGYGNAIYINFGGGTSGRFGHLSKFNVKPGDVVDAGDIIGYTGGAPGEPGSGRSTGPHLHYEVRQNGKAVDPRTGRFRTDAGQAADDAQKQAEAEEKRREQERLKAARELEQFGRQAAASIAQINGEFSAQPTLIERSRTASAALDATIAALEARKPTGFEGMIAQAGLAKAAIEDGIDRPIRDFVEQQRESYEVGQLVAAGQLDQADALRTILSMERERGQRLLPEQREAVLATVEALRAQERQIERNRQVQQLQLSTVDDIRQIVTDTIYEGPGSLADLPGKLFDSFKRFQAEMITENLFGDTFQKLKDDITGADQVTDASARMAGAVDQVSAKVRTTGDALDQLAGSARGAASGLGTPALPGMAAVPGGAFDEGLLQRLFTGVPGLDNGDAPDANAGFPAELLGSPFAQLTRGLWELNTTIDNFALPDLKTLTPATPESKRTPASEVYGKQISELIKKVGINEDTASLIGKSAGKGLAGAFEGQAAAGFASMLGVKTDSTGAAIGGALGGLTGIPGGSIIGGLLGGIAGGLFAKPDYGTASVTSADGDAATSGSSGEFRAAAAGLAGSVQQGLHQIADQLGAELGQFSVAIGTFDGKYRVNTSATSEELHYKNFDSSSLFNFDKDEGAAISFAIADAIKDGAILGLSAAQQAALRSTDDLDQALNEAMKVGQLELDLGGLTGQLEKLFKDFDRTAADRVELAKKYGLDLLAVEKLNAEQRADLLEDTLNARVGSLKDLLSNIQYGDLFEGSASERRSAILGEIADAKEDADAGVEGATDRLADLYRRLTESSREAFGTAGPEYADDRSAAVAGIERAIQLEQDRVKAAEEASKSQAAALATGNALADEGNALLASINAKLGELVSAGGGGSLTPDFTLVSR